MTNGTTLQFNERFPISTKHMSLILTVFFCFGYLGCACQVLRKKSPKLPFGFHFFTALSPGGHFFRYRYRSWLRFAWLVLKELLRFLILGWSSKSNFGIIFNTFFVHFLPINIYSEFLDFRARNFPPKKILIATLGHWSRSSLWPGPSDMNYLNWWNWAL